MDIRRMGGSNSDQDIASGSALPRTRDTRASKRQSKDRT